VQPAVLVPQQRRAAAVGVWVLVAGGDAGASKMYCTRSLKMRGGNFGEFVMVRHSPVTKSKAKRPAVKVAVAVMLTVAIAGALWVPIYAHSLPKLGDFPFFYWYQLILVPVTAILCWLCYLLLRTRRAAPTARHREGARR
jgi:Protein of unknown function (DUF3311)